MAVRLSVIMVQSAPPSAAAGRTAEAVVGELIGLGGIDVTLVGPLAEISSASTDQLTLESLSGDVAVLDWQSPSAIMASLHQIGFGGQRSAHENDPDVESRAANLRRIYALDLAKFSRPEDIFQALTRLNASRQVRTFSLGLSANSDSQQTEPPARATSQEKPRRAKNVEAIPEKPLGTSSTQPPSEDTSTSPERGESLNLDDLLDQLDQLDP
jgi:hypothetical protein